MFCKFYLTILSIYLILMLNEPTRGDSVNENLCFELLKRFGENATNVKIIEYQLDHIQISLRPGNSDDKKAVRLSISYQNGTHQRYQKSFLLNVPLISPVTCATCGKKRSQYWNESPETYHRPSDPPIKFKFSFNNYVHLFWIFLNAG